MFSKIYDLSNVEKCIFSKGVTSTFFQHKQILSKIMGGLDILCCYCFLLTSFEGFLVNKIFCFKILMSSFNLFYIYIYNIFCTFFFLFFFNLFKNKNLLAKKSMAFFKKYKIYFSLFLFSLCSLY